MRFRSFPLAIDSALVYSAAVNAVGHVVVAHHALLDLIALAPKAWFLHLESL
jgi:hypothetical protein